MSQKEYLKLFKQKLTACFKKGEIEEGFSNADFDNKFQEIKPGILSHAEFIELPELDETMLRTCYDKALREVRNSIPVQVRKASTLTKDTERHWLTDERISNTQWHYTERYFDYLEEQGRGKDVLKEIGESSQVILSKLGDPISNQAFYSKGMVVGEVQSGKTGNFNAVINRAIDSGYKLIIVLSGIMEDLRSQTQERIEKDVVGEGLDAVSKKRGGKGVGAEEPNRFGGNTGIEQISAITSVESDFQRSLLAADFTIRNTHILVCKKNVSILKNLLFWLHDCVEQGKEQIDIPLLVLDDEADNASLNNEGAKGREYASKVNGHIRALLALFSRKSYLGYTATPFANVLQDRNEVPEEDWVIPYKVKGEKLEKRFVQENNLFPDDFIVLLNPPSNYVGAKKIFETRGAFDDEFPAADSEELDEKSKREENKKLPLVSIVEDHVKEFPTRVVREDDGSVTGVEFFADENDWEKRLGSYGCYQNWTTFKEYKDAVSAPKSADEFPNDLPLSLREAVICFILAIAVRDHRKEWVMGTIADQPHNTMLVHVSRFTSWQNKTAMMLDNYVKDLAISIQNDKPESGKGIYGEIRRVWFKHFADQVGEMDQYLDSTYVDAFLRPVSYEVIQDFLESAINGVVVKAINSVTKQKLDYSGKVPQKVIAIGGNRLSRGFTLEGLTINYFVRSTNYSDTLLQMGRWFGYRPGYLDCCKIFTTHDSVDKFDSTTLCIEDLETRFRKMEAAKKTPANFVLMVRKHPGALKITRPSIMRNTEVVKWSYQDQLEMTTLFDVSRQKIEAVWSTFKTKIAPLFRVNASKKPERAGMQVIDTTAKQVMALLKAESNFAKGDCEAMRSFIKKCNDQGKLQSWKICLKTTGRAKAGERKGKLSPDDSSLPWEVELAVRRGPTGDAGRSDFLNRKMFRASGRSANIISGGLDLSAFLSEYEVDSAEQQFVEEKQAILMAKDPNLTKLAAREAALKINPPERIYREQMSEGQGILNIYLFDAHYTFNAVGKEDPEFDAFVRNEEIDLNMPLVGYAIGFPKMVDVGGEYVKGDYDLDLDEANGLDGEDVDNGTPQDEGEVA